MRILLRPSAGFIRDVAPDGFDAVDCYVPMIIRGERASGLVQEIEGTGFCGDRCFRTVMLGGVEARPEGVDMHRSSKSMAWVG